MTRKRIPAEVRKSVYEKYNGHCAYCGKEIDYSEMQVDHLKPLRLGGVDAYENYMPTCRSCNHYKRGNSLESWREMLEKIPEKLERIYIYKVGLRFGLIEPKPHKIVFYFEKNKETVE